MGTQIYERDELWMRLGPDYGLSGLNFKFYTRKSPVELWPWAWARMRVVGLGRTTLYTFYIKFIF